MMGIPTKEWDGLPSPELMFFQTSSQEVLHMEPFTDEVQEVFLCNKHDSNIMCVGDTTLAAAVEDFIDENWCLIGQSIIM